MPRIWTDLEGNQHRIPTGNKLQFSKVPLHARLRAFVMKRDDFTCQLCGVMPDEMPIDYDGKWAITVSMDILIVDHIVSRRSGGDHNPDNLQCLCETCNKKKIKQDNEFHKRLLSRG